MLYLLLGITCNTLLFLILKGFDRFRINTLQAIVVNYLVAGTLGVLLSPVHFPLGDLTGKAWIWVPPLMGALFISIFLLIARTAQTVSISAASVANKMSVIIPVIAAVLLYNDHINAWKISGVVLTLFAVYFTSKKSSSEHAVNASALWLPVIVFIGSGIIDALVNYTQQKLVDSTETPLFIACSFLTAFVIGSGIVLYKRVSAKTPLQPKALVGGLLLGIPNYFSIWCIVQALEDKLMESSMLYPVANLGIIVLSAIGALLLFREKLSAMNWAGIGLSVVATLLIIFSDKF